MRDSRTIIFACSDHLAFTAMKFERLETTLSFSLRFDNTLRHLTPLNNFKKPYYLLGAAHLA